MRKQTLSAIAVVASVGMLAAARQTPVTPPRPHTRAETLALVTRDVAAREHVAPDQVRLVNEQDRTWPDEDLGCVARKGLREPAAIPGYRFVLEVDGRRVEYHTDRAGRIKRCPPAKPKGPPAG